MSNPETANRYRARFRCVLHYIDEHLEGDVSLERLSDVAEFSKFHFHRRFATLFGIDVSQYVQPTGPERASYQLTFRNARSILDLS